MILEAIPTFFGLWTGSKVLRIPDLLFFANLRCEFY
jgi:hypothetical protein